MILSYLMGKKIFTIFLVVVWTLFLIGIFLNPITSMIGSIISSSNATRTVLAYPSVVNKEIAKEQSIFVPYAKIPRCAIDGIISVEDKRFYNTNGIDIIAAVRVFIKSFSNDHTDHGGSTLTQQLARRIIREPRHTANPFLYAHGLLRVLYYTFIVNTIFSKHEILTLYLNSVYYGRSATGIERAAYAYFGTDLDHLTFGQCVYLTGLPQAPSIFGGNPKGKFAMSRYHHVIWTMVRNGYISVSFEQTLLREQLFIKQ